jgi:hypothetical protein
MEDLIGGRLMYRGCTGGERGLQSSDPRNPPGSATGKLMSTLKARVIRSAKENVLTDV